MKYSIIIPLFNKEKYIKDCINSLLKQSYTNFEAIIVDDGSTDNSVAVANEIILNDNRFKIISKENGGLFHARLTGIENAKGDYILNLDSDDYYDSNLLEECDKIISKHCADIYMFGYRQVDEKCIVINNKEIVFENKLYSQADFSILFLSDSKYNPIWAKVCKKDLFDVQYLKTHYGRVNMCEDKFFTIEILKKASNIVLMDKVLYNYRQSPYSIVHLSKFLYDDVDIRIYDESKKMLHQINLLDDETLQLIGNKLLVGFAKTLLFSTSLVNRKNKDIYYKNIENISNNLLFKQVYKKYYHTLNPIIKYVSFLTYRNKRNIIYCYRRILQQPKLNSILRGIYKKF